MRAFSYAWLLPVTRQRWRSHRWIHRSGKPMLHADLLALLVIEVYIEEIGILDVFGSCDLDLDPMTFIYELDPYCLKSGYIPDVQI